MGRMNKRGISSIIVILLLITIAVVASVMLYIWVLGFGSRIESASQSQSSSFNEMLKIEGVKIGQDHMIIYVRNLGKNTATVDSVYIVKDQNILAKLTPQDAPVKIEPGKVEGLIVYPSNDIIGKVSIKISSADGFTTFYKTTLNFRVKKLVINEVELNPYAGYEWIELYNPTNERIDLTGYKVYDKNPGKLICTIGSSCITSTTVLAPHSYLKVSWNRARLNNDGDGVVIRDSDGKVVDETPILQDEWDTAETWQRIPDAYGEWTFTIETEGFKNQVLKVYINEYEANPSGSDTGNEWIELYNPNDVPVDVSHLELWDQEPEPGSLVKIIPENSVIPPHGYLVISWSSARLNNKGDGIVLKKADRVYDQTPNLADKQNNNYTWQRVPDGSDNWKFKTATKNSSNNS